MLCKLVLWAMSTGNYLECGTRQAHASTAKGLIPAFSRLMVAAEARGSPDPLESVTLNGTALPESTVLEIAGLHADATRGKAWIGQAGQKLDESG